MAGGLTLADKGAKTISLRSNGSSMRCTVLLGVTMSGEKLAPLVVFKGVPDARIQQEFNNQQFASYPPQMVYCCQAKKGMLMSRCLRLGLGSLETMDDQP